MADDATPEMREILHRSTNYLSSIVTLVELSLRLEEVGAIHTALEKALKACNEFERYLRETRREATSS